MLPLHLSPVDDRWYLSVLPWVVPGVALALVVSIAAGGRLARWLRVPRVVAWLLITSTGVILAGTVSPLGLEYRAKPQAVLSCDFSRIGPAGIGDLIRPTDPLGNILMFIPLGFAIALAARSSRKAAVLAGAFALPFLIEATQLVVTPLERGCQSADVVDNLTGLALGLFAGTVVAWLAPGGGGPDDRDALDVENQPTGGARPGEMHS